jgi:hypothetical protein
MQIDSASALCANLMYGKASSYEALELFRWDTDRLDRTQSSDRRGGSARRGEWRAALAGGLTPRAVLDKLTAIQMLDVDFPTTDGPTLILSLCRTQHRPKAPHQPAQSQLATAGPTTHRRRPVAKCSGALFAPTAPFYGTFERSAPLVEKVGLRQPE